MKLQKLILVAFLASAFFISCGDSAEKKEDDKTPSVEMKVGDSKVSETTTETNSDEISDEAIAKVMKDLLVKVATGEIPVPEIIDTEAAWIDKIGKLSHDTGVAKKLAELGDTPEEIMKKIKEMAADAEK